MARIREEAAAESQKAAAGRKRPLRRGWRRQTCRPGFAFTYETMTGTRIRFPGSE